MPLNLPSLAERSRERYATPKYAMKTRLDERTAEIKDEKAAERAWRKGCIARDGKVCRCCQRKVVAQLALAPERLEVHHIASRADQAVRWDLRNGIVLCSECHEKVTRYLLVLLQHVKSLFSVGQKAYIDASKKVTFRKKAA